MNQKITEQLTDEVISLQEDLRKGIAEKFEADIPDDWFVINIKWNNVEKECFENHTFEHDSFSDYVYGGLGISRTNVFTSYGLHLNGENKVPHVHLNIICPPFKIPQNPSDHRKRWCKKEGLEKDDVFKNVSFKFHDHLIKGKPKYSILSYPLKENNATERVFYRYGDRTMRQLEIDFLKSIGTTIYETELANNLRNDKHEERKQESYMELYNFALENKSKFSTFREMVLTFDDYVDAKPYDKKPCPKNYKSNLQKIGNALGLFKYSALVL